MVHSGVLDPLLAASDPVVEAADPAAAAELHLAIADEPNNVAWALSAQDATT